MKALRKAVLGHEGHGLPDDKKAAKKALMAEVHHDSCVWMEPQYRLYKLPSTHVEGA
jgi:hypothetical protein